MHNLPADNPHGILELLGDSAEAGDTVAYVIKAEREGACAHVKGVRLNASDLNTSMTVISESTDTGSFNLLAGDMPEAADEDPDETDGVTFHEDPDETDGVTFHVDPGEPDDDVAASEQQRLTSTA